MNDNRPPSRAAKALVRITGGVALLVSLALIACGGGGSDSTTATADRTGVKTGGTGAYAAGRIKGFGSIIVGTIEFDDSQASVLDDDGNPITRTGSELRLGMTIDVDGGALTPPVGTNPNSTAVARSIRVSSEIVGRVTAVDAGTGTLTVLGQTVKVNPSTVLDDSANGNLAALLDRVVEVYALPGATSGQLVATRVEFSAASDFKLRGLVSAVIPSKKLLTVGGATLSYEDAGEVPEHLLNTIIRARVSATPGGRGVWNITSFGSAVLTPPDGLYTRVEGTAVNYDPVGGSFSVNGIAVDASGFAAPAGLATGAHVEVRGRMSGSVLVASQVEVEDEEAGGTEYEVKGSIESTNPPLKTFVVRGVTIDWSNARFSGGGSAQLTVGRNVEVHGRLAPDRTKVMATEVDIASSR